MARLDNNIKIRRPQKLKNVLNSQRLRVAEGKLARGAYTPMEFLRAASYSFATTNKHYFAQLIENLIDDPELGGNVDSDDENEDNEEIQGNNEQPQDEPQTQALPVIDDKLCEICFEREKNAIMVPCGHTRFCHECGNECIGHQANPTCPFCRQPNIMCTKMIP